MNFREFTTIDGDNIIINLEKVTSVKKKSENAVFVSMIDDNDYHVINIKYENFKIIFGL